MQNRSRERRLNPIAQRLLEWKYVRRVKYYYYFFLDFVIIFLIL